MREIMSKEPVQNVEGIQEVEEVDVLGQEQYTKKRLQERQGRRSTILGSQSMGSSNRGGKTLLG